LIPYWPKAATPSARRGSATLKAPAPGRAFPVTVPAGDARHVFEDDQLGRVILECFQRQPHAAQRQAVQGLVFVGEAECLGFGLSAWATRRQLSSMVRLTSAPSASLSRYFASQICREIGAALARAEVA
jgi:hypothetical protein